jgi:L-ribulokinase
MSRLALGLDYGTNSVRALIIDADTGEEVGTGVFDYPSGEQGVIVDSKDPHLARQHPGDYVDGIYGSIELALQDAAGKPSFSPEAIRGIGVDTTGSTPMPVDSACMPLGMDPQFRDNPHAQAWLWKDHTSIAEAEEITEKTADQPYLRKCGGTYSSEWFWAKMLRCERSDPAVLDHAATWMELSDFVPAYLTGVSLPDSAMRNACAAGHKAMWNPEWGGLPSEGFLERLSPRLASMRGALYDRVYAAGEKAGTLAPEVAARTGLSGETVVSVGAMDAHLGAVGSGIRPGMLVKIMGTSTCDIMVAPNDGSVPDVPGLCGIAQESVLPNMLGIEAGQSAVGDLFNWGASKLADGDHERLQEEAARLAPGESGLIALDWNNGNRTILVDQALTGLLIGQTLQTSAVEIYRALVEATAFGALRIIQRIEEYGVPVEQIVCCGGIAEKSGFVMQVYADILNRPIRVAGSPQTCALGACIAGSVAAGLHSDFESAQEAMVRFREAVYKPNPAAALVYRRLYGIYMTLHDSFGIARSTADLSGVMKELLAIQKAARTG